MEPTDSFLVSAYSKGDTNAFGVLYDRYLPKIYKFIYYKTFDTATAEDLTSSTFLKALKKIATFDCERGNFSSWLYSIARNTVIDHYRSRHFDARTGDDVFELIEDVHLSESLDAAHSLHTVEKYLKKLTASQREIVMLRIWEDKSYKEIAEIVGGTEGSVKMSFSRIIRQLRTDLGPLTTLTLVLLITRSVTHL